MSFFACSLVKGNMALSSLTLNSSISLKLHVMCVVGLSTFLSLSLFSHASIVLWHCDKLYIVDTLSNGLNVSLGLLPSRPSDCECTPCT